MGAERIVSFLPSATELLFELGAHEKIVGVTHECVYPEAAKSKPRVISSVFDSDKMSSAEIDRTVSELARNGKDLFIVNEDALRNARPDLIIAQGTCAVCSAHTNELNKALQILGYIPQIEVLDPHSIQDILESVGNIARKIESEEQGAKLVTTLQNRVNTVKARNFAARPKVLCIEWVEPFFTAGHWIPEMVQIAGGINAIGEAGKHSRRMSMEEVAATDPDIIVMMPCGFDTERTSAECVSSLAEKRTWKNLRAVKEDHVFCVDANSYFSKPSIRTITGIEILAKIFHPQETEDLIVPAGSYRRMTF